MVKCILEEHNELTSPKILLRFTHPVLPKLAITKLRTRRDLGFMCN
jgi:hypothetical protein